MSRELHELNLEIQKVRRELGDMLERRKDTVENDLIIKVSQKLDNLIVRYIKISEYNKGKIGG